MHWVISYDIIDDKRRAQLARMLESWGLRVQYSVFECQLSPQERKHLAQQLQEYIDPEEDSLRWYPLCNHCLGKARHLGKGTAPGEGRDYFLV